MTIFIPAPKRVRSVFIREKSWFREYGLILAAGVAVGIAALILTASGNPKNMGFCIA